MADSGRSRDNEREKQQLLADRDRQNAVLRSLETELHRMELEESQCQNQLRDKDELERRIVEMKTEIAAANTRLKVGNLGTETFAGTRLIACCCRISKPRWRKPKHPLSGWNGSTRSKNER